MSSSRRVDSCSEDVAKLEFGLDAAKFGLRTVKVSSVIVTVLYLSVFKSK